jgi:hypothetical protein
LEEKIVIASNQEVVTKIVKQLRVRAHRLRRNAAITIVFIGFLLVSGIAIFGYAGEIARAEAESEETNAILNRVAKGLHENTIELTADIIRLSAETENKKISDTSEVQTILKISETLERTAQIIKDINERPIPEKNHTRFLISTITTRIGIVVLLLFLVQILVPLYRYNIKLSGFYEARANALELLELVDDKNDDALERLVSVFSPDSLEFGKAPATPTQQAIDMAKDVIGSYKKV